MENTSERGLLWKMYKEKNTYKETPKEIETNNPNKIGKYVQTQ